MVATRKFTKETRNIEPVSVYRRIYNAEGKELYGYWTTENRLIVRRYYDYHASLLEGIPLEPAQFMSTWQRVGADGGLQSQTVVSPEGGIVLETLDQKLTALGAPEPRFLALTDCHLV